MACQVATAYPMLHGVTWGLKALQELLGLHAAAVSAGCLTARPLRFAGQERMLANAVCAHDV
jgi:hypothetical protein